MNAAAASTDSPVDTIAAIATAPGRSGVGIVRLSGPGAFAIGERLCGGRALPAPRTAALREFVDAEGAGMDRGLVLRFAGPLSFTGEDVVELHAHGGPVLMQELLRAATDAGARVARAGEFSERAFLNDRLDLAQAEAIADLIDAGSRAAVRAAHRSLDGAFSRRIAPLVETLIRLRRDVEAALDFADEDDVPWLAPGVLAERLRELGAELAQVQALAAQGRRLREGLEVAIVGRPNVGKSTLLNRLAGHDAAIVSPVAGTTRDLLREAIVLDGLPVHLVDTAGLRETADTVEQEGVRRAWAALGKAELVLLVRDEAAGETDDDRNLRAGIGAAQTVLVVRNKCDLRGAAPERGAEANGDVSVRIAAATGAGIDLLIAELKRCAGLQIRDEASLFSARARHLDALRTAGDHLAAALAEAQAAAALELVAEALRLAQSALDEITGRFTSEDLLGRIFGNFCIGK